LHLRLLLSSDIDNAAEDIVRTIQQAATKATSPINPYILNPSKSLPADIKQLIINTRHARAKWQSSKVQGRLVIKKFKFFIKSFEI